MYSKFLIYSILFVVGSGLWFILPSKEVYTMENSVFISGGSSSSSSSSSSFSSSSSNGESFTTVVSLSEGQQASININQDKFVLKLRSSDLTPLTYDASGNVKLQVALNGIPTNYTFAISSWFVATKPNTNVLDQKDIGNGYVLKLVDYSGDFDSAQFFFELTK
jgi:hypothetical protein